MRNAPPVLAKNTELIHIISCSAKVISHLDEYRKKRAESVSTIDEDLYTVVVYFFITHKDAKTRHRTNLITFLLRQLYSLRPDKPMALKQLQHHMDAGQYPEDSELDEALRSALQGFDNVYIVIDGVDECQDNKAPRAVENAANTSEAENNEPQEELRSILRFLVDVLDWNQPCLHLAIASRTMSDIEVAVRKPLKLPTGFQIDLSSAAYSAQLRKDMAAFIEP